MKTLLPTALEAGENSVPAKGVAELYRTALGDQTNQCDHSLLKVILAALAARITNQQLPDPRRLFPFAHFPMLSGYGAWDGAAELGRQKDTPPPPPPRRARSLIRTASSQAARDGWHKQQGHWPKDPRPTFSS